MGFEPMIPVSRYAHLANECLQPLGHVSVRTVYDGGRAIWQGIWRRADAVLVQARCRARDADREAGIGTSSGLPCRSPVAAAHDGLPAAAIPILRRPAWRCY